MIASVAARNALASYVAQTIRANFPDLGIGGGSRVVPLRSVKRA
jgi:hypothetical protein